MKTEELSELRVVATSYHREVIAAALDTIFRGQNITHVGAIRGESRSGRVFLTKKSLDAVSLMSPISADVMAEELLRLGNQEARYDPPANTSGYRKGWEISLATIDDCPVAIARAAWIKG